MNEPLLARLSLNQATVEPLAFADAVDLCARHQIPFIGAWRHKVAACGLRTAVVKLRDAQVGVSSLCRGGFFAAPTPGERRQRHEDNLRAIDEASALGAPVLVLVCGGLGGVSLDAARRMVADGIAALVPHAHAAGVRLGVEPLHPMFAADRSVVVTLAQANALASPHPEAVVGVVVDAYAVWWDPQLWTSIDSACGRIVGFHVSDWLTPPPDMLKGRGLMGDGTIDLAHIRTAVDAAGYSGPIEVEIFNEQLWSQPADDIARLVKERYLEALGQSR